MKYQILAKDVVMEQMLKLVEFCDKSEDREFIKIIPVGYIIEADKSELNELKQFDWVECVFPQKLMESNDHFRLSSCYKI